MAASSRGCGRRSAPVRGRGSVGNNTGCYFRAGSAEITPGVISNRPPSPRTPRTPRTTASSASAIVTSRPSSPRQRRDPAIGDPAGDDQIEVIEVGPDVEREAVRRDPSADANANRGQFLLAPGAPCPDAGQSGHRRASIPNPVAARISTSSRSRT
jgi:hypothetical protein